MEEKAYKILEQLFNIVIIANKKFDISKKEEQKLFIYDVFNEVNIIVKQFANFFQNEIDNLKKRRVIYTDSLSNIENFRVKSRDVRIKIRNLIKESDYYMEDVNKKIFAIGVMGILQGGIHESVFKNFNRKYWGQFYFNYDGLINILSKDNNIDINKLYLKEAHTLLNLIDYDKYKEISNMKKLWEFKMNDVSSKNYKMFYRSFYKITKSAEEVLIEDLEKQQEYIFASWEIVCIAYSKINHSI